MIRQLVRSSNVHSVGYDNGVVEVAFRNGYVYHYHGVSLYTFNAFLRAPSKGRFVHYALARYRYRRVA